MSIFHHQPGGGRSGLSADGLSPERARQAPIAGLCVRGIVLVALASMLSGLWPSLRAQQYDDRVDVRVIQVPVTVWKGANAVGGLTRDDFEVYVNGTPQPIEYFDVLTFDAPRRREVKPTARRETAPVETATSLNERRLTVLLFDVRNFTTLALPRTRRAVEKLIGRAGPGEYFAVAVYDGSMSWLAHFTDDRLALERAIKTLQPSRSGDPLGLVMTVEERTANAVVPAIRASTTNVEGGFTEELITGLGIFDDFISVRESDLEIPPIDGAIQRDEKMIQEKTADSWLWALGGVADELAPLEGVKQVAVFTEGIGIDQVGYETVRGQIDRLHRRYRRAGVILDFIDVGGLRAPGLDTTERSFSLLTNTPTRSHTPDLLFPIAFGTGGRVIQGASVETAVGVLSRTKSVTYVLGLLPAENEKPDNDIVVKLKNAPAFTNLSYRRGYSARTTNRRDVSRMVIADALLNDIRLNDVTVRIYTDGKGTVDVGIPGDELLAHTVFGRVTVDVYLYLFDDSGEIVGWKRRKMTFGESAQSRLRRTELVRRERFSLPPGHYTAKTLVHIAEHDLLGFQRQGFEVVENP